MSAGLPLFPQLPTVAYGAGFTTDLGVSIPPSSQVRAFVLSSTAAGNAPSGMNEEIRRRTVPTLAAAVAECRSGQGDVVVVLPGHSESVTDATLSIPAGTNIIGMGNPKASNAPTFRWTATAAQWNITAADVTIRGLKLRLEGANGVVSAIAVGATGFALVGCDIETVSGASNKVNIGVAIASAGTRATIAGNLFRGIAGTLHGGGGIIDIATAQTPSHVSIVSNWMTGLTSATGPAPFINIVGAATDLDISENRLVSADAGASPNVLTFGAGASTGIVSYNAVVSRGSGVAASTGIIVGSTLCRFVENYHSDEAAKSGALNPAVAG